MAACANTFGIIELLERTLLHLPLLDLLRASAVCKTWQSATTSSPRIQRALFYRPVGDATIKWFAEPATLDGHCWYAGGWKIDMPSSTNGIFPDPPLTPLLNPLLKRFFTRYPEYDSVFDTGWHVVHDGIVAPITVSAEYNSQEHHRLQRVHRKAASWRPMTVTQPPCRQLDFECSFLERVTDMHFSEIKAKEGEWLTVSDMISALREHWHTCPACPLSESEGNKWEYGGGSEVLMSDDDLTGWSSLALATTTVQRFTN